MRFFLAIVISLLMMPITSYAKISNTNELIAAMQKKYGKSWYKTATFVQQQQIFNPMEARRSKPGTRRCQCLVDCASISHR